VNPFMLAAAASMFGAAVHAFWHGNPISGILFLLYGTANAMLAFVKG
jgi:hypothetical protein